MKAAAGTVARWFHEESADLARGRGRVRVRVRVRG